MARGEAPPPEVAPPDQSEVDAQKMLADLMASQSAMMDSLNTPIADGNPANFATVVEEEDEPADGQPANGQPADGQPAAAIAGNGSAGNGAAEKGANGSEPEPAAAAPVKKKKA